MAQNIIQNLAKDTYGIFSYPFTNTDQSDEIKLRTGVANKVRHKQCEFYLNEVCKHHSVPVMDREVRLFLKKMPKNACILDIGGCWGWSWRELQDIRPDVKVYLLDFIYENLLHARELLKPLLNKNVFLIHGDATQLIFPDNQFDGVWTVQAFQHIPDFSIPVQEAYRVLKPGGYFINYSWNNAFWVRVVYAIVNKVYHVKNYVPNRFWLARASEEQKKIIASTFHNKVIDRYSEVLFTPDFRFFLPGRLGTILGYIDSYLSNNRGVFSSIARQHSFHVQKPMK